MKSSKQPRKYCKAEDGDSIGQREGRFLRLQTRTPPEISEQRHLARQRITDEQRITVESEEHIQTHLERHRITNEQSRITVRKEHRQTC